MATFARPGVYIQEVALPQTVTPADTSNAVGAFAGALSQGPTSAPVLVSTWSDFFKTFGGLNDSYPTTWAAYNFFANGGRNLYVKRVVGSGATAGSLTITDGTGTTTTTTAVELQLQHLLELLHTPLLILLLLDRSYLLRVFQQQHLT